MKISGLFLLLYLFLGVQHKPEVYNELKRSSDELAGLLRRFPQDAAEVQPIISYIKSELKLRGLRWKSFEQGEVIANDLFVVYPVRVELLATYERLTDALLNIAASNYIIVVDEVEVEAAEIKAPLVSLAAKLVMLIYTIRPQTVEQLRRQVHKDPAAQLIFLRRSIETVLPLYESRVGCWTAMRTLGRLFPRSLEVVMTEFRYTDAQVELKAVSRVASAGQQLEAAMRSSGIFSQVELFREGPFFSITASVDVSKAYQQWLEGVDTSDTKGLARDPFRSLYTYEQLTQGAAYPPLEERIEEYLKSLSVQAQSRIAPFLVAELSLAGVFYSQNVRGAIFKTPDEREVYAAVGAYCYNGRFADLQQGKAVFEEETVRDGKVYRTQVVKAVESSCLTAARSVQPNIDPNTEVLLRERLSRITSTLSYTNVDLYNILPVLSELAQFNYVLASDVSRNCGSFSRERAPFVEQVLSILRQNGLGAIDVAGVFVIFAGKHPPQGRVVGYSVDVDTARFANLEQPVETIDLAITQLPLGKVLDSVGAKYGVRFAIGENESLQLVTATMKDVRWDVAILACLRACGLAALVEADRVVVTTSEELARLHTQGKVKF
ncbi:MAG: type 4a pilus biogenesis protein PilO [Acidobacteriota bacterium]|nr:type 4a pilus biogenesis protein PilO [Blastocatellia bacterium]MDW8413308.1 type 4a pilus biogenesis protein PilO [Acidobacteriota bacterium]